MELTTKNKIELRIFGTVLIVLLPFVAVVALIDIFLKGSDFYHEFYLAVLEMTGITMAIVIRLFLRLRNFKSKFLDFTIILLIISAGVSHYSKYLLNLLEVKCPPPCNLRLSLASEIFNFTVFTYSMYCIINFMWIIQKASITKRQLIVFDYVYFTLGLGALFIKYFSKETDLESSLEITSFTLGAVAVALRFSKLNGELILSYEK